MTHPQPGWKKKGPNVCTYTEKKKKKRTMTSPRARPILLFAEKGKTATDFGRFCSGKKKKADLKKRGGIRHLTGSSLVAIKMKRGKRVGGPMAIKKGRGPGIPG